MNGAREKRRRAERTGRTAERFAAIFLTLKGFSVLDRRIKTPAGEIDLSARRSRLIVFVEVKARAALDDALFAVTPRTQQRISTAAALYLSRRPALAECAVRYDIIAVSGWRVRHIADAWRDAPQRF